jgi:hypothetical protein
MLTASTAIAAKANRKCGLLGNQNPIRRHKLRHQGTRQKITKQFTNQLEVRFVHFMRPKGDKSESPLVQIPEPFHT